MAQRIGGTGLSAFVMMGGVLLVLMPAQPVRGDSVSLPALKDATLYQPENVEQDRANGSGRYIFTGKTKDGFVRRAVLAFDIAAAIPSGSVIDSAALTLRVTRTPNPVATVNVGLHRLTADWGEGTSVAPGEQGQGTTPATGDATWQHRFYPGTFWSAVGGDFVVPASATIPVINKETNYTWGSTAAMVADVQQWLDNPASNFGWIVLTPENSAKSTKRFDSSESPDQSKPALVINYTPTQAVGACCTGEVCQLVTQAECTTLGGSWGGTGTSCTPNPCADPSGACCSNDGTCTDTTQSVCETGGGIFQSDGSSCALLQCPVNLTPWLDALPLPEIAAPVEGTPGGAAHYSIAIRETTQQLHSELTPTLVWAYDDGSGPTFPGPTIEARRNQHVDVDWINDLRYLQNGQLRTDHALGVDTACIHGATNEPRVVVHLHGGHVPAGSDGYPEHTFLPGGQDEYAYPNQQQAGTLWYHDHALGITRLNVYLGLAGMYILRDDTEDALDLPAGEFEVPLVLQDRKFNPGGSLYYPATWQDHFFGDKALVNGKVWPYLNVTRGKYRFRILNGSGSRVYTLSLSPTAGTLDFTVIGTEGGLLEAPAPEVETLTIGPGERFDVVVDFQSLAVGNQVLLQNSAPAPFPNGNLDLVDIMKFIVVGGTGHTSPLPGSLRPVVPIDPAEAVETRDFVLRKSSDDGCGRQNWLINDLEWRDITEYPELDTVEIWRFINDSGVSHPMHMHLVMFQVLDRQEFTLGAGGTVVPVGSPVPPPPWEKGWKDTAMAHPGEILRVIARFEDYAGKFPYHCHILEHEDHEMMRQFQTIVPGCIVSGDDILTCDGIDNDCNGVIDDGCLIFEDSFESEP